MWNPTPKQKKFAVLAFGVAAIALFLWLFMRSRSAAASIGLTTAESAQTPAPGNNLYAINFPATTPTTIPGTVINLGGTQIGNNCGCCDNGTSLVTNDQVMQNLAAASTTDDVLMSMFANLTPTGQSDLGYAFQGGFY